MTNHRALQYIGLSLLAMRYANIIMSIANNLDRWQKLQAYIMPA